MTGREAALAALTKCRRDQAWASPALDALIREGALDRREAALASQLTLGVLQNTDFLDYYIDLFCSSKLQPKLRDILRLGAYQILFAERIPVHAAVSESVTLSRAEGFSRASGMVNAVLRRLAEKRDALPPIPGEGTAEWLSIRYSHPLWLVKKLLEQHDYAFTEGFLSCNNAVSPLDIQINTLRCTAEEYRRALERKEIACEIPAFPPDCLSLSGERVSELPGFEEGLFYVQDRAARMAVEIAGVEPGMKILDACAAPGGKSFAAAIRMKNEGRVLARDIHPNKLRRVQSGAERLGLSCIETAAADARTDDPALHGSFDLVIADLPCSGLGVIRKKPEIRIKKEEEIAALPALQREILNNLAAFVRPGGVLLYTTCTVLKEENEGVAEAFLRDHPEYRPVDFTVGERGSSNGCYTFWPQVDGTDGFFAAKLQRSEA